MEFCDKLVYVMTELNIRSAELARKIPVDPALVSRWRAGRRVPKDDDTISRIAGFVTQTARTDKERLFLNGLISDYEAEDLSTAGKIARWFFDGRNIQLPSAILQPQPAGICFPRTEGFLTAVAMLEYAARQRISRTEFMVCVSTEHMDLILDERIGVIWERLYRIHKRPVPVILEQDLDSGRLSMILSALLPYIQSGRLLLHHVPSTQRQFCYNLTIIAKGVGMVMAMEPPGARDASVSVFVDQPAFVGGVGERLAEITESAAPMIRRLHDPADERSFFKQCFRDDRPVLARFDTVNLLYAEPDSYKELLMANGVPYKLIQRRISEFSAMRSAFEGFLASGPYKEMASLMAIRRLTEESQNTVPDLRFIEKGTVIFPAAFVKSLIQSMTDFLTRFPMLEMTLTRGDRGAYVMRIKEDSLLFLQNISDGKTVSLGSENWLVINAYTRDFYAKWNAGNEIFGRSNVIYTLNRLIKGLEGSR
ncbi:MAG: hypothetical protein LBL15_00125 [Oscillospiraceae bacterium]|nr:hypothetical protein [Oscillospiraceae bacterium]